MIAIYRNLGYEIFELPPGAKAPPPTGWQRLASVTRTIPSGWNHGVSTEKFGVLDFDDINLAREFYRTRRDIITTLVKTPKGLHAYFSGQLHNAQKGTFDVRGIGGYVVGAGSVVEGKKYEFVEGHDLVPIDQLKPFPMNFIPERKEVTEREPEPDGVLRVRRAEEYGKQIHAISGAGGHNNTFRFVCFMRDIGLTEGEAYLVLERWNDTNAGPKWSPKELVWKVKSAFKKGSRR